MSTYTDCRDAALGLLADENLTTEGIPHVFTELDVIVRAAMGSAYSEEDMRIAQRDASQVMGEMFRTRKVARYGPVSLEKLGFDHQDYARIASKIIYAHPEKAPAQIKTPNGTFPRMMTQDDTITRTGRRLGANRTDLTPWDQQDILGTAKHNSDDPRPTSAEQREIMRLKAENAALYARVGQLENENQRLRHHNADAIGRQEVEKLVASVSDQLTNQLTELQEEVRTIHPGQ